MLKGKCISSLKVPTLLADPIPYSDKELRHKCLYHCDPINPQPATNSLVTAHRIPQSEWGCWGYSVTGETLDNNGNDSDKLAMLWRDWTAALGLQAMENIVNGGFLWQPPYNSEPATF